MPFVTVGQQNSTNVDLYYEDHGAGAPVVLIHGWPLSAASWEKQVPALLAAGRRVVMYDRRGFGRSNQPAGGYDYDTLAADLNVLMTKLDLRGAALVGFSMGGGEVARYVGKYGTDRVAKAAFLGAVPPFLRKAPDNPEGLDPNIFEGIKQAIAADRPAFLEQFLANFFNTDVLDEKAISKPAVRANWVTAVNASPIGTTQCVDAWGTDFRADLAKFAMPSLVFHGDADRIVPLAASGRRTAAMVQGSKLVVVKGGPHGLNWTHPAETNRALVEFLGA